MSDESIAIGDRVVNLQVPGVFLVVRRHGRFLDIESAQGVRLTVRPEAVRRLDDPPAG
jgi:hypothetical protein